MQEICYLGSVRSVFRQIPRGSNADLPLEFKKKKLTEGRATLVHPKPGRLKGRCGKVIHFTVSSTCQHADEVLLSTSL